MDRDILGVIEGEVVKLDPALKGERDDETFQTAVVLLAAAFVVGPDIDSLVAFTGYSGDFIAGISHNMRASGFWEGNVVNANHWFRADCLEPLIFWTDTLVATGQVAAKRSEDGQLMYRVRDSRAGLKNPIN